ncbi:Rpn family recombination-promoting nuclease/putative transposase [uncultured Succinatimonas sp.]|uniref:Rpn family recombination-promoting nuclease/putative transposase n=1 Tax=uncultured Succinatimonas sp. TaxID=1262973 RepID=UPI0025F48C2F|nr:Rpn family recombination-promoting nuclease/putative transposase [uncultured Succinatimonas sp.]
MNKLTFLNREVDALKDDGKACRMDILAQIDDGSIIDVEVQLLNINDEMTKRSLYYFGKLYTERLKSGESYHVLRPCIIVNLLNFNLFDDLDAYLTRYQMQELTYGRIYSDDADIFVVELPKWKEWIKKQNTQDIKNVNRFCRWLSYLTSSDPELVRRLALHDRLIQEALMIEKRYTMDDERMPMRCMKSTCMIKPRSKNAESEKVLRKGLSKELK